jgi:flagellar biogenesis protein FliO
MRNVIRFRKKVIASLIIVLLTSSVLVAVSALSSNKEKSEIKESTISRKEWPSPKTDFLSESDPNFTTSPNQNPSPTSSGRELFYKMTVSVIFVIALGAMAVYTTKKFLPKITNLPGKEIRLLETTYIGPRKAVHLLQIGNQRLLIGSTNDSITMLAHLSDNLTDVFQQQENQEIDNSTARI